VEQIKRGYLPAAGHDWALPLYDPLVKLIGADAAKKELIDQVALRPDDRVLDIGCGTGVLATLIKRVHPGVHVTGLDPDPKALARGRRKAERASVSVQFDQGFSDELPYPDASFDRVFSSFMFHHLREEDKLTTLREVRRVLAPGGSLQMMDVIRPEADAAGWRSHMLRSNAHLKDNSPSRVLKLMSEAGFGTSKLVAEGVLLFGFVQVGYYEANVPL
jgi:ubiquinone/menaquinone biosynthesis C-methylase UbiE